MAFPDQPVIIDDQGTKRFRANPIVRFLLDNGPNDMNTLAMMNFSKEDAAQFAQLIGYSISGYGELPYVTDGMYERAVIAAKKARKRK